MIKTNYPLNLGCTEWQHGRLGVHAVVNARAGRQALNHPSMEDIELARDARKVRDKMANRVAIHQFNSRFFRRNLWRVQHLLSEWPA